MAAFLPLFALLRSFSSFSCDSGALRGPHSRVFRQPGKKTLQRGPLVAFSAAELLIAQADSARLLSAGSLAHPKVFGPQADWRLCRSRAWGCLSLRASFLIRFAFRLVRLSNLLNARSVLQVFLYEEAAVLDFARRVEKLPAGANHHSGGAYRCFGAANRCPGECEMPSFCAWVVVL